MTDFHIKYLEKALDKIADLEAKLAESEKYNKMLLEEKGGYIDLVSGYSKKCKDYEQQLAEKEKENLKLKGVVDSFDKLKQYHKDAKQLIFLNPDNIYADGHKLVIKKDNQDKISFAVEKLEKVKNEITPIFCVPNGIYSNLHNEVFKTIDNQIKKLKENQSEKTIHKR